MVATPHYLASIAARDVLKEGGSAVDAALCAVATLGCVLPHMTGIGGDAFWLIHDANSGRLAGINGSGRAGRRAVPGSFAGETEIPARGPRAAITVPGAVDSWRLAHATYGRLPLARLLEPAIEYARDGFPVTPGLSGWIEESRGALSQDLGSSATFLPGDKPLARATRLKQPGLARTLAEIARHGPRAFYEKTAEPIARYLNERDGLLDAADFAEYQASWVEPVSTQYRDVTAYQLPPPSQGVAGLMILNYLARKRLGALADGSAAYFNALIEAIQWAFRFRDRWWADPLFVQRSLSDLLDPSYPDRTRHPAAEDAQTRRTGNDTVFVAAVDTDGNAVSLVQSLYYDFGAAVLDPETGVLLQNRGSFFSLNPNHPNVLAPGKQSASTLMAGMLFREGRPYLVHGTQGGEGQAQTNAAVVTRVVDYGLGVQEAIEAPRLLLGRSWGDCSDKLLVETHGDLGIVDELSRMGQTAESAGTFHARMGTAQAIRLKGSATDFLEGGADPRGEGLALGY